MKNETTHLKDYFCSTKEKRVGRCGCKRLSFLVKLHDVRLDVVLSRFSAPSSRFLKIPDAKLAIKDSKISKILKDSRS